MITPSKLPFEVRLRTREGDRALTDDRRDLIGDDVTPGLSVVENQDIGLLFRAPADFRMTMDGIDVVSVPGVDRSGPEPQLLPQGRVVTLFEAKNFPLVPGYYVVTVRAGENAGTA